MRRALFAREFRSALVPNLITVGVILATLAVIERLFGLRLGKAEDVRVFTDAALLIGLVVSGFISGERCFPSEVKESRMLFLSSLPIPRSWAWLIIVSARLLAALASLIAVFLVRRPLLTFLPSGHLSGLDLGLDAALLLFAYVFFFSAGNLFALLFRRPLFSYLAGFLILVFLLGETSASVAYSMIEPYLVELATSPFRLLDSSPVPRIAAFLGILFVSSIFLSCRLFVRGEVGSLKRRIENQVLFGVTATAFLGFVFCAESSTTFASVWGTWTNDLPASQAGQGLIYGISPNGKYLSVLEALKSRPFIRRMTIIDTGSGHVLGRHIYAGLSLFFWSSHGDVLNLVTLNNSPLDRWGYLIPGTADWLRLSPQAREISKHRFREMAEVKTLEDGRAIAVFRQASQGRVLLLDGATGLASERIRAPLDGGIWLQGNGQAVLVYFENVLVPRKAWIVDSQAHEVRISRSASSSLLYYILFGEAFEPGAPAKEALRRNFGSPLTLEGTAIEGDLLMPPPFQLWTPTAGYDANSVYFLAESTSGVRALWVRPTTLEGRWEKLRSVPPIRVAGSLSYSIDFRSGIGVFLSEEGAGRFFVYDPKIGIIPKEPNCAQASKSFLGARRTSGLNGLLIGLTCMDSSAPSHGETHYFQYVPGSKEIRFITTVPTRPLFSHLYFDEKGKDVWTTFEGTVWSSIPGKRNLRLWPLQTH
ncbi:MAG TPA: hypothetical protein VGG20_11085 [Thermoanaerobaculia bacterium]|jgi:hypothetical protein